MSDVEADLVIGLRKLARIEDQPSNFVVEHDGFPIIVDYVGGSSSRLTLSVDYDRVARAEVTSAGGREAGYRTSAKGGSVAGIRPMSIKLRREDSLDRSAKSEGISREHQTGDARFDEDVYIDSPTTDAAVLAVVLSEKVRAGAMELLSLGFDAIVIDDDSGNVTALMSAFGKLREVNDAPSRVVRAFAALLSGLPPVKRGPGEHAARSPLPMFLAVTGGLALMIGAPIGLFGIAGAFGCTEPSADGEGASLKTGCGGIAATAFVIAFVAGAVAAAIARMVARPVVSGHSDSHKRLMLVTLAALAWAALLGFLATAYVGYAGAKV